MPEILQNIIGLVLGYGYIGIVIYCAKFFNKYGEEASRKFIHIMLANWWIIAMFLHTNAIWASIGPVSFIIINYLSYKKDLIKVMEREQKDGLGTVYYAISLFLMVVYTFGIIHRPEVGLCACFTMGYGDGLASVIGKKIKSKQYSIGDTTKSIAGTLTMFIVSLIIFGVFLICTNSSLGLLKALILAIIATGVEAISIKGTDNLTVPIITCLLLSII